MPLPRAKYAHSSEPSLSLDANVHDLVLGAGWIRPCV